MKGGLAASIIAVEALIDSGMELPGALEISGTVDEESGGYGGVHYLAQRGWFSPPRVDHVIIPEPLNVDRVCIGHRGVWWAEIETRGRMAHGSMPFLGDCAVRHMNAFIDRLERDLYPKTCGTAHRHAGGAFGRAPFHDEHQFDSRRPGRDVRLSRSLCAGLVPHGHRPPPAHRRRHGQRQRRGARVAGAARRGARGFRLRASRYFRGAAHHGGSQRSGRAQHRRRDSTRAGPRGGNRLFAGHLRSEAHRSHRQAAGLHRLWSGNSRPGPSAG